MRIEKSSLPKGMSYALKSSVLEHALTEAGIGLDVEFVSGSIGIFFDANFWPANRNVAYERLYIRAGAINAGISREANAYLESTVIPEFVAWIRGILALPDSSPLRRETQYFVRELPGNSSANA